MKYGLITIDVQSVNLGNRLIEYAIKTLLGLPKPAVVVSMFTVPNQREIDALNTCEFILLPGSTILAKAKGNSDALVILSKIRVPKYCVGASGWKPEFEYYTEIMKYITPPIGCRDPDTLAICQKLKIPAILTGCPTMYLPKRDLKPKTSYTVVGFARTNIDWQIKLLSLIPGKKVAALQEYGFELPIAKRLRADAFTYDDSVDVMRHYSEASSVVTGRLHGLLPALSQEKPVMFFGAVNDSRFTLLKYLGIQIYSLGKGLGIRFQKPNVYNEKKNELKNSFYVWAKRVGIKK